ncbi:hypothetical protein ACFFWD_03700 [Bradyrhizobium erythrophlei]|uniref:hypothetical protein n=1 Tax=Bradyrhizobium erythrophlei TaxID=1437360 RepID=UPI0035EAA260
MQIMHRIIDAPPALRRFLDARAMGASREALKKLSDLALVEQAERSGKPFLRLVARDGAQTDAT